MLRMRRGASPWGAIALVLALAVGLAGCGKSGGKPEDSLRGTEAEQAQRLYRNLKQEHSLERDRQALDIAHSLLDYYPGFDRNDEVLVVAISSARRLDDLPEALRLTDELLTEHPHSPLVDSALLQGAEIAESAGDNLRAADYRLFSDERGSGAAEPAGEAPRYAPLLDELSAEDLATLLARHRGNPHWPYLGYLRTGRLLDVDGFAAAETQVAELESAAPRARWTAEARLLLTDPSGRTQRPRRLATGPVRTDQIGLLCPLTGRYAVLGNAFVDAALLAVQAAADETGVLYELKMEDTGGDPVVAAMAARRLCEEQGSIALLGALMSAPTTAVALVADSYGVPLVSPTATNDRVWELGNGIFQTNLTGVHEIRLLAQLAVRVLLKERFAILRPDSPEGVRQAEVFRTEVETWGGEIVIEEPFAERSTDFRAPILAVRERRPEVIFVPASVDQMALLGPQLDFYRSGSLIMGLSNFKSQRLLERTGTVLDGVVFTDDVALFPAAWTAEFNERWLEDNYPREATALALKAYQATRMLTDTMHRSGATNRAQLAAALQRRLESSDADAAGPEPFARSIRIIRGEEITAFPAEVYSESWALTEGAMADSLAAAAADSLGAGASRDSIPEGAPAD